MDILSLIHENAVKEDIAWAVIETMSNKIAATVNLTDIDKDNITLVGG